MKINVEEIAREIRNLNRSPERRLLANLYLLDLDEYEVEPLAVHWEVLCACGINFQSERVHKTVRRQCLAASLIILLTMYLVR